MPQVSNPQSRVKTHRQIGTREMKQNRELRLQFLQFATK